MKLTNRLLLAAATMLLCTQAQAQTGADYMTALKKADQTIVFDVNSEGQPFHIKWGMDTAWNWDYNVNRGIAHIGLGNFETGRISFQPTAEVIDNGDGTYTLTDKQKSAMKSRCTNILLTGCNKVEINNDQEDALSDENKENYENIYLNKPEAWYKLIKASVAYAKECGVDVISIAPFNEPDYSAWGQGTQASMKEVCRLIKADSYFDGIRVCGGNTLNCDCALDWYNYCLDYVDEGNTHQLAGSFDSYAAFFTKVKADGKIATADELHNVGEAIVGANYGMENGIWWGFDSKARGQFCIDSNEGVRIGYGENRSAWTSGAVYRNDVTGEVHGYLGSSERQANTSSFSFVSKGKDVFFNGYGPTRMFVYDVPGGTGYQTGQINAERLFDITWGEDVAPGVVDSVYQIMNLTSKKMLTWKNTENVQTSARLSSGTTQQWHVYPGYTDGDISYWFIDANVTTSSYINLNVLNNSLKSGAGVICYNAGHAANEQWYLKYAKDGYYYIISRLSNKYLCGASSGGNVYLSDAPEANITSTNLKKYLWRFQPIDAKADITAPEVPTELTAKQRAGSIELNWTAPVSTLVKDGATGYIVLRGEQKDDASIEWSTIGRIGEETTFVDNTAIAGTPYIYKVKAVDKAGNRSVASDSVYAQVLDKKALLCQLNFDKTLADNTANKMDLSLYGTATYSSTASLKRSGEAALKFDGSVYGMIPYSVTDNDEMTITCWVYFASNGKTWQRIFDFGNGEDQYMFFCPSNGSEMRFVMKDGGDEQILTNGKTLGTGAWKHVAVTIKPLDNGKVQTILYIDGTAVAQSDEFTIKPSDIKPSLCFIGRSMFKADPFFGGRLDDFRIYNYALSADEIAGVMEDLESLSKDIDGEYEEAVATSIQDIKTTQNNAKGTYDLSGRKVSNAARGIVIEDGKKVLK